MEPPQAPPTPPVPPHQYTPYEPITEPPVRKRRGEGWRSVISTLLILIAAPLIALAITQLVFQSYEVDGESMETTLQNHDRLIVLKLPKTISKITKNPYIPPRETIVIFAKRGLFDVGRSSEKQLIKRVIALPGERVVVKDSQVTVYNAEHPEGFNPDNHDLYPGIDPITSGHVDLVVPEGEVFVLGDNRGNSLDSRSFGTITADEIVGKLSYRMLPANKVRAF